MLSLRNILPKSIFWRTFLIIILPIVIMQMVVAWFFFNAHWVRVTSNLSDSVAADVAVATQLFKENPTEENAQKLDALLRPDMELSVVLRPDDNLPTSNRSSFFSNLDKTLRQSLTEAVDAPFWFDTTRYPNHIDIRVQVDEGVLRFIAARERVFAPSHDLRTPLTRLKLQLAMQDNTEDNRAAQRDVDEMEAMLNGYLDFARGMGKEKPQATQLSDFISKSVRGRALDVKPFQDREVSIRPLMLQRCLDNLISNALKYGKSCVLSVAPSEGFLLISVEDDGPGIPAEQRQNAFKAFQRLDEARNQNTEGVGLGLSISQDIAQLHGGTILLSDSGLGGLKATLRLPL